MIPKNLGVLMRDRYISRFNLVITLKSLLSERDITTFLSTEVGADLIPKLRSLYCRVP